VNLDPACPNTPYKADISIASLITLEDVMAEFNLGPNGGMLYCLEFLEANFDWLEEALSKCTTGYFVFDLPGQVELSTDHMVRLEGLGFIGADSVTEFTAHSCKAGETWISSKSSVFPLDLTLNI
jgi:GTPase SAR1 family protein